MQHVPGLNITIFYVATQLATEQFLWHSHTSPEVFGKVFCVLFCMWNPSALQVEKLAILTKSELVKRDMSHVNCHGICTACWMARKMGPDVPSRVASKTP